MTTTCLSDARPEIAARIDESGWIIVGLDFDGTLTPLRPRPEDVTLAEPARALLARLAGFERVTVMIVSGRSLEDLTCKAGLPGLIYAGNHGLEITGPGLRFVEPAAAAMVQALEGVTADLRTRLANLPGALVEPKGLTTSIHYRSVAPEQWDDLARIVHEAVGDDSTRFVLTSGHCVWEIRPRVSWNKGHALDWTIRQLGDGAERLVFYLGDDQTDEDAFAVLPHAITVKVGMPETLTQAHYWLPDPDSVQVFLEWLVERLACRSGPAASRLAATARSGPSQGLGSIPLK